MSLGPFCDLFDDTLTRKFFYVQLSEHWLDQKQLSVQSNPFTHPKKKQGRVLRSLSTSKVKRDKMKKDVDVTR